MYRKGSLEQSRRKLAKSTKLLYKRWRVRRRSVHIVPFMGPVKLRHATGQEEVLRCHISQDRDLALGDHQTLPPLHCSIPSIPYVPVSSLGAIFRGFILLAGTAPGRVAMLLKRRASLSFCHNTVVEKAMSLRDCLLLLYNM